MAWYRRHFEHTPRKIRGLFWLSGTVAALTPVVVVLGAVFAARGVITWRDFLTKIVPYAGIGVVSAWIAAAIFRHRPYVRALLIAGMSASMLFAVADLVLTKHIGDASGLVVAGAMLWYLLYSPEAYDYDLYLRTR